MEILSPTAYYASATGLALCVPCGLTMHVARRQPRLRNGIYRRNMKAYMCVICGFIYEEDKGDAQSGISPNTKWEDVPLSWRCPDCGAGKEDFEMIEI